MSHEMKCRASATSDPPVDCDMPFCGCNPAWQEAIAALQECGWLSMREADDLKTQLAAAQAAREALTQERDRWKARCQTYGRRFATKEQPCDCCDLCAEPVGEGQWEWVEEGWSLACKKCLDLIVAGRAPGGRRAGLPSVTLGDIIPLIRCPHYDDQKASAEAIMALLQSRMTEPRDA